MSRHIRTRESGQPGSSACFQLSSPRHCLGESRSIAKPPTLTDLFPPGAARGQTVVREGLRAPSTTGRSRAWIEGRGHRDPGRARRRENCRVVVAADAAPGLRWLRLHDEEGATTLRPFVVGVLPEVVEVEPNDEPKAPQRARNGLGHGQRPPGQGGRRGRLRGHV